MPRPGGPPAGSAFAERRRRPPGHARPILHRYLRPAPSRRPPTCVHPRTMGIRPSGVPAQPGPGYSGRIVRSHRFDAPDRLVSPLGKLFGDQPTHELFVDLELVDMHSRHSAESVARQMAAVTALTTAWLATRGDASSRQLLRTPRGVERGRSHSSPLRRRFDRPDNHVADPDRLLRTAIDCRL